MAGTDIYGQLLKRYWGYDDFRGIQRDIIESISAGRDTLGLMPTGGGKSVTFQVPALAQEGTCVVITPLIALMKDQVQHLRQKGISAAAVYSGMTHREILTALDNCIYGNVKLLYVSPERLASDLFQTKLRHMRVSFITVDEAHCISQWGYDFRPSYLKISTIRELVPHAPVLALTATATPEVVGDIQQRLGFGQPNVFSMSFERTNLAYVVRRAPDKQGEMLHILRSVAGSAIVYVRSRARCKEMAQLLEQAGITATFYHAGLEHSVKDERQQLWQQSQKRVMVATNAFGMGIDKANVRLVIHYDCPDSIEAYFQEAGRAGRDGRKAYAVLLYNDSDLAKLRRRVADNFPDKDYIKEVYEHLAYFFEVGLGSGAGATFPFDIEKFCRTFRHFPVQANAAITILDHAGYLEYNTDPHAAARLMFLLTRNELDRLDHLSPHEDALITTLLRLYGGLFTDYCYIDEELVASRAGLDRQQVYLLLRGLTQRHIVHFIPQRKMPTVGYTVRREDITRLIISREVYEDRKEQFARRIDAMIAYATNDHVCRSRQLLAYFGEERADDCHHCDVCLDQHTSATATEVPATPRERILALLADGTPHPIAQLATLAIPHRQLDSIVDELVKEERITVADGTIRLNG